jgi:hypothetical protein
MASATTDTITLEQAVGLDQIEAVLAEVLDDLEPDLQTPVGRGRPRILPDLALWGGLLVCVARGFSSQLALWRLLSQTGLWHYPRFPICDQAVYKRLAQGGTHALEQLFAQTTAVLAARLAPFQDQRDPGLAPFATDIVALDESTLDPLARRLPVVGNDPPPERRLPGKVAALFDIRRQCWRTLQLLAAATQNEKVAARELVASLARGTLILADLGYFGFAWFDDLTAGGYWWISRVRAKTSYEVVMVLAQQGETLDALVWLGVHRADRAKHLVRLIQFRHGGVLRQYLTNVRDPALLPAADVVRLYARRWDIELALKLVKRELGLHLWWSSKDVVIHQQLWAAFTLAQIVQGLRLEIAARAEVDVYDVSVPLMVRYLPIFAAQGEDPIAAFVERGRAAGFIRPARRVVMQVPEPPLAHAVSCGIVEVSRKPRYAHRKCGPQSDRQHTRTCI